jgi:hypothetical protein
MLKSDIIRAFFFMVFFGIGAAAVGITILSEDLVEYYSNRHLANSARELEQDPNHIKRIAPAVIGAEYQDANAVYPEATARQLAAARKALEDPNEETSEPTIPTWLSRCTEPRKRTALFFSGVALILISFVCFKPVK